MDKEGILITGASRGIGAAITKNLWADKSAPKHFVLVARESEDFRHLLQWLKNNNPYGKGCEHYFTDLSCRVNVTDLIKHVINLDINIDILVNNAGYANPEPIHQITVEDFDTTLNVNLITPFLLVQGLLQKGNNFKIIVNIASTAGIKGRAGWLTYSTSKAAMINMSDVMREELRIFGTRVICLAPGRCATDLRKKLAPDEDPQTIMQPENLAEVLNMMIKGPGKYIDSEYMVVRK